MGLDMYLKAQKYVSNWDHATTAQRQEFQGVLEALGLKPQDVENPGSPHLTVDICVAYWRKANQIHKWFVDNAQDGEYKCKEYVVSREKLQALLSLCNMVLGDREKAKELLPPQSGFFFGGTDTDDWYFKDVQYTCDVLGKLLNNPQLDEYEFSYRSSW